MATSRADSFVSSATTAPGHQTYNSLLRRRSSCICQPWRVSDPIRQSIPAEAGWRQLIRPWEQTEQDVIPWAQGLTALQDAFDILCEETLTLYTQASRVIVAVALFCLAFGPWLLTFPAGAEDELAKYAREGNKVGVDPRCFAERCTFPTRKCMRNPDCLKGLSCLAKCKGEGSCSTACFAKYGSNVLDDFLHCAVEKQDCVHVPRDSSRATWTDPDAAGSNKAASPAFRIGSLQGRWYKVMGMDARYDCFDCQVNHFSSKVGQPDVMMADVSFRIPRPRAPGFFENHVTEELLSDGPGARRSMHSMGRMFGLTFWENWYVIGENEPEDGLPPYKFVFYTGHTLQGNYEGAFVYTRTPELPMELMPAIQKAARANGLDPSQFCKIRNMCFKEQRNIPLSKVGFASSAGQQAPAVRGPPRRSTLDRSLSFPMGTARAQGPAGAPQSEGGPEDLAERGKVGWLADKVTQLTAFAKEEWNDWFEDPIRTSNWLIEQQERVTLVAEDNPLTGSLQPGGGSAAVDRRKSSSKVLLQPSAAARESLDPISSPARPSLEYLATNPARRF